MKEPGIEPRAGVAHPRKALQNVGGCFSEYFLFEVLLGRRYEGLADSQGASKARETLGRAWTQARRRLGRGSSIRETEYFWYRPLLDTLGFRPVAAPAAFLENGDPVPVRRAVMDGETPLALIDLHPFETDPETETHPSTSESIDLGVERSLEASGLRWGYLFTGPLLRLVRSGNGISRTYLEVDFPSLFEHLDPSEWEVFWNLFRYEALASGFLDRVGEESHVHAARVQADLRESASRALLALANGFLAVPGNARIPGRSPEALFRESLVLLYRLLFILYAESRDLLPLSNPVYRDAYSLHHLRDLAEREAPEPKGRYFWESLRGLFALLGKGARSAELALPSYNGRLFSPKRTPLFGRAVLHDDAVRDAILALSLAPGLSSGEARPERVSYEQLGIHQFGSIYEGLLGSEPDIAGPETVRVRAGNRTAYTTRGVAQLRGFRIIEAVDRGRFFLRDRRAGRKSVGAFYTPESFTATLVRKALEPLVAGKTSREILRIKVLDPAMGSGAFLIQAARFLGEAYRAALRREGRLTASAGADSLSACKRAVTENCLYGVDILPLAVELAKVSLWLETASAGKPLTFLDHRLRPGNSLFGASLSGREDGFSEIDLVPDDIFKGDRRRANRSERADLLSGQLNLFARAGVRPILERFAQRRKALDLPEESPEDVRAKEDLFERLYGGRSEAGRLKHACDLWCSLWLLDPAGSGAPTTAPFREACERVRRGEAVEAPWAEEARSICERERFFHWELEFPEVFARDEGGFDAVIGNPPWEVLKPNRGEFFGPCGEEEADRASAWAQEELRFRRHSVFLRKSGRFVRQGTGDLNSYKFFLELAHRLLRPGGRFGMILPSGIYTDQGASPLRRLLFTECCTEGLYGFENRGRIFPIDERYKFALLWGRKGGSTYRFNAAFMLTDPEAVKEAIRSPLSVDLGFVERFSRGDLSLPECRNEEELRILMKIFERHGAPQEADRGQRPKPRTEFHIRNDREHIASLAPGSGKGSLVREIDPSEKLHVPLPKAGARLIPFIQGKCIHQYRDDWASPRFGVPEALARERTSRIATPYKLVHRRIARNTDERTLIVALIPARYPCEMNATVIDVTPPLGEVAEAHQLYLLGLLNSFVLDFVIRKKVTTTINMFFFESLPLPAGLGGEPAFEAIASCAARLVCRTREYAPLWESAFSGPWRAQGPGFGKLTRKWKKAHAASDFTPGGKRDGEHRARLRAAIDAQVAGLFGLARDELAFLLDGFDVARRKEEAELGEYRSKRLILETFDGQEGER